MKNCPTLQILLKSNKIRVLTFPSKVYLLSSIEKKIHILQRRSSVLMEDLLKAKLPLLLVNYGTPHEKIWWSRDTSLSILTSLTDEIIGHLTSISSLPIPMEKAPTIWIGGWLSSRAWLESTNSRKIFYIYRKSNTGCSVRYIYIYVCMYNYTRICVTK
jgi:hypothetical protein